MSGTKSALVVANSQYEHSGLRQLTAPTRDAEMLAEVLGNAEIGGFQVKTLVNQRCADVMHEIEIFFSERARDDLLLLYFSGHGLKDEDGKLYLAALNTDPRWLRSTAIPDHFINQVMTSSRSKRQVMLLDCCYSGAFAKALLAKGEAKLVLKDHFEGRGRVLLTASDAIQYSFEAGDLGHTDQSPGSVFTQALVAGLNSGEADRDGDGFISLDELYDFVHERVQDATPNQRPMKWAFDVEGDIMIARNPAPFVQPAELPAEIREATNSKFAGCREEAVHHLERLMLGKNRGLSVAARTALQVLTQDDSRRVSEAAAKCLASNPSAPRPVPSRIEEPKVPPRLPPPIFGAREAEQRPYTQSTQPSAQMPIQPQRPQPVANENRRSDAPAGMSVGGRFVSQDPPVYRRGRAKIIWSAALGAGVLAAGLGILINTLSKRDPSHAQPTDTRQVVSSGESRLAERPPVQAAPNSLAQLPQAQPVVSKQTVFEPSSSEKAGSAVADPHPTSSNQQVSKLDPSTGALSARELLDKVVQGMGGPNRVLSVKAFQVRSRAQLAALLGNVQGSMETLVVFPDKVRVKLTGFVNGMPVQVSCTRIVNGSIGWEETSLPNNSLGQGNPFGANTAYAQYAGAQRRMISGAELETMRRTLRTHPIWVAQNIGKPGYSVTAGGSIPIDGKETRVLDVMAAGAEVRWFVDPETGYIIQSLKNALGPDGFTLETCNDRYSDWQSYDGLVLPARNLEMQQGDVSSGNTSVEVIESVEINPRVDDSVFQQPN